MGRASANSTKRAASRSRPGGWPVWPAGLGIAAAVAAAYASTLSVPFILDDFGSIGDNPTIRRLWPIGPILHPPSSAGQTVGGRPVLNLSLALNYAVGGDGVRGYHAVNLAIHAAAALALFGIVRRTLGLRAGEKPAMTMTALAAATMTATKAETESLVAALATALLWALHPLQTESVTYVSQRAESLCGLFYLLTLYCFVRGAAPVRPGRGPMTWFGLAWLSCLAGTGSKEVIATAPLIVLLYDRTFVAGSFARALRERGAIHGALASTWAVLAVLVASTGWNRGRTVGFGGIGVSGWTYGLSQLHALVRYARLIVWPRGLTIDYGAVWAHGASDTLPGAALAAGLVGATAWALLRRPPAGFLGAWFLVILAPSSSVIPGNRQTIAEHRLYLPLAAVAAGLAVPAVRRLGRGGRRRRVSAAAAGVAFACVLGTAVRARNAEYATGVRLFRTNVERAPDNPYAHINYGRALSMVGRQAEAQAEYRETLRLKPGYATAWYNLGISYDAEGRREEGLDAFRQAVLLEPGSEFTQAGLGGALAGLGRFDEAAVHFRAATRLEPGCAGDWGNLGSALGASGHPAEAVTAFERALTLDPSMPAAEGNLGMALFAVGRRAEAIGHLESSLARNPDEPAVRAILAYALLADPARAAGAKNPFARNRGAGQSDPSSLPDHR